MGVADISSFGNLLRRHRKIAGLTQEDLAERAHLSVRGISDLERGARRAPRSDTLALLIDALELEGPSRREFEAAARGLDEPGAPPVPAAPQAGRTAGSPLVGRMPERAAIERHLTGDGPPVLLFAGEPGIGKSRLLRAASEYAERLGYRVLMGGCHRYGERLPYSPLLEALQRYLRERGMSGLRAELQGCSWLVRLLPELAAAPIEPVPEWLLTPEQERRLMGQAVERFLSNIAGLAGTVLVLDDLQWAGSDAVGLLTDLARSGDTGRLRIVGAYRETEVSPDGSFGVMLADLAQAGLVTQRRVGPLTSEEASDLLRRLVSDAAGDPAVDAEIQERLLGRADGVPFFLVSCAQALREGALDGGVPWDVAQGVRQRVSALPPAAQETLRVASVAGRVVARALLMSVIGRPEADVLVALEAACQSGLLAESGEHDYEVTHDLIREVVETDLGAARRTALHHQIALALAAVPGDPPVEAVAYHFAHTDRHDEAAGWLERAGDAARAQYATAAALEQYRAALERAHTGRLDRGVLRRLNTKLGDLSALTGEFGPAREAYRAALPAPEPGESETDPTLRVWRAEIRCKIGDTWEKQSEYAQALAELDAADAEGRADNGASDLPARVRAAIELSRGAVFQRQGDNDSAAAAADRAEVLLRDEHLSGGAARARALNLQGNVALHRGNLDLAESLYQRSLDLRERLGDQSGSATSWNNLGRVAFRRGDLTRAEECFQHALDAHERIGEPQGCAGGWHNLGACARDRGDLVRADECHRRCLAIAERIGDVKLQEHSWHSLGILARDSGALARAEEYLRRSLDIADRIGDLYTSAHTWHQLGAVSRARGDLGHADEYARRALELFERLGDAHGRAECWTTLGAVSGERGNFTPAAWYSRRARRLAHGLGVAETEALATLEQARARLMVGRLSAASTLLDRAQEVAATSGLRLEMIQAVLLRAELLLRQARSGKGGLDAVQKHADDGLSAAIEGGYRQEQAHAHRLLAQCALGRGHAADAQTHLAAALAIQEDMGAALEIARTKLVSAEAAIAQAEANRIPLEAHRLLTEAREVFLGAGATWDLDQARQNAARWDAPARVRDSG